MNKIKFGTDGWRDLMYDQFNLPNVRKVIKAISQYIIANQGQDKGLVICYDARFFAETFAKEAANILISQGIKVFLGERDYPTPVTAYGVKLYNAFGAIMFTASHNPPEYNGIKFIPEYAGPASLEITKAIEDYLATIINNEPESNFSGPAVATLPESSLLQMINPTAEYINHLKSLINVEAIKKSDLHILVDPMYATGRDFLSQLFSGCSINEIHNQRDPFFGGFMPDPQGKFLNELKTKVAQQHPCIGLALDGDADRFGIIDNNGTYLTPNQVIPLVMTHLITTRDLKGAVVRSVATTHMIDRLAALHGVTTYETPVGFKYIGEKMRQMPVIIGGEESGGLSISGHIPEKDGILACALMAEMMAINKKSLLELLDELYARVGQFFSKRIDLHTTEKAKAKILKMFEKDPPEWIGINRVKEIKKIDGYKIILDNDSWVLIRPSGTEALLRFYLEAHSQEKLLDLTNKVEELLKPMLARN